MAESNQETSLGHVPSGKRWEFDRSVTNVFDDMISRSIPQYESMRVIVEQLATPFFEDRNGHLLDLGCSTGLSISQFAPRGTRIVGVEISESMLEAARQRFVSYANVEILELDLRKAFPSQTGFDVALSIFTLQFIPVEHRRRVVADVYRALRPGGAFLVAEKTLAEGSLAQKLLTSVYHRFKVDQGYSEEEVERKALALEGSLVAQTASENESMLLAAGFRAVEPVWRWGPFAAWLVIR